MTTSADGGPPRTNLAPLLRRRIEQGGPIGVDAFVRAALSDPEHGYYTTRDPLGRGGDFVTAPEISAAFGELLGLWCVVVWQGMGRPAPLRLAELGAGGGTMIADAWRAAVAADPAFAAAARLHIVETSAPLRDRQRRTLSALPSPPSVQWHRRPGDLPPGPLLLLANEFLDALPVRQWVRRSDGWHERRVDVAAGGEGFAFVDGPLVDDALVDGPLVDGPLVDGPLVDGPPVDGLVVGVPGIVARAPGAEVPEGADDGDVFETCPEAEALVTALGARLAAEGGAALLIDYGHAASGFGETLQAVRGHRFADPLAEPGAADLSHHVDFARLCTVARAAGAAVFGPIPQGLFLGRLGIAQRAEAMAAAASPERAEALLGAVRRLVHPGRMGVLFKAFAITDPGLDTPPGFDPPRR